jgi:DNA-binding SARP family transcriptional activator
LPYQAQRLIAYLALAGKTHDRVAIASSLWLDVDDGRARRNLRAAMWQVRRVRPDLISQEGDYVQLGDAVVVDVRRMHDLARALTAGADTAPNEIEVELLSADLLPDWSDEWVVVERERIRQLRLHALEDLGRHYTLLGHHAAAVDTALIAVAAEPLRESAQRVLIEAHLAERNVSEAANQLEHYQALLRSSLDVDPSDELVELVHRGHTRGHRDLRGT